eukprot:SAG31_NODE_9862_length_1219_cov_1.566071_2_plen_105_part_00
MITESRSVDGVWKVLCFEAKASMLSVDGAIFACEVALQEISCVELSEPIQASSTFQYAGRKWVGLFNERSPGPQEHWCAVVVSYLMMDRLLMLRDSELSGCLRY